jgi:hypothetical protein
MSAGPRFTPVAAPCSIPTHPGINRRRYHIATWTASFAASPLVHMWRIIEISWHLLAVRMRTATAWVVRRQIRRLLFRLAMHSGDVQRRDVGIKRTQINTPSSTLYFCLYAHLHGDCGIRIVSLNNEVIDLEVVDVCNVTLEREFGECARYAFKLLFKWFDVIAVDMCVAQLNGKLMWLSASHLRNHAS